MPNVDPKKYCPGCSQLMAARKILQLHHEGKPHPATLVRMRNWLDERIVNPVKGDKYRVEKEGQHEQVIGVTKMHKTYIQSIRHPLNELNSLLMHGHQLASE